MTPHSEQLAPGGLAHGRYRIVEKVGTGGIATVYRAVDEQLGNDKPGGPDKPGKKP